MSRSVKLLVPLVVFLFLSLFSSSCGDSTSSTENKNSNSKSLVAAPAFDAQRAYGFVQQQVDFGPRVPNTRAHKEASAWFKEQFEAFGAQVYIMGEDCGNSRPSTRALAILPRHSS